MFGISPLTWYLKYFVILAAALTCIQYAAGLFVNMFKFLSNNIYKFNQENDEWEVDYIPLYSTEDYPYWVCDFIIIKTDKATGKKIPFDKYSRLEMSYLEHLFDVNDSESLRRFFVDYKICYDWYFQKNSLIKCYTNKIEE